MRPGSLSAAVVYFQLLSTLCCCWPILSGLLVRSLNLSFAVVSCYKCLNAQGGFLLNKKTLYHYISWQITSEFLLVSLLFHLVNLMQIASSSLIEIFFSAKGICEYHYSSSSSRMLHYSNLFLFFFSFFSSTAY